MDANILTDWKHVAAKAFLRINEHKGTKEDEAIIYVAKYVHQLERRLSELVAATDKAMDLMQSSLTPEQVFQHIELMQAILDLKNLTERLKREL